jgi:hypothetical protein
MPGMGANVCYQAAEARENGCTAHSDAMDRITAPMTRQWAIRFHDVKHATTGKRRTA